MACRRESRVDRFGRTGADRFGRTHPDRVRRTPEDLLRRATTRNHPVALWLLAALRNERDQHCNLWTPRGRGSKPSCDCVRLVDGPLLESLACPHEEGAWLVRHLRTRGNRLALHNSTVFHLRRPRQMRPPRGLGQLRVHGGRQMHTPSGECGTCEKQYWTNRSHHLTDLANAC
ncbi:hypothetical protein MYSTI_01527 [Myxococcus stipitatus DSM 14675]|uniref:Uncharacterized protein n=1 Tax=Myxococcus stipitatus (strain DSM 14675 / JCM 12634 / Mx s8) TaxID=1278073 RepID=L7U5K9_MYXSD|nr:hypothetical protein MYSTI_01527 [Myxococcus stipitatus DSM 14675]